MRKFINMSLFEKEWYISTSKNNKIVLIRHCTHYNKIFFNFLDQKCGDKISVARAAAAVDARAHWT